MKQHLSLEEWATLPARSGLVPKKAPGTKPSGYKGKIPIPSSTYAAIKKFARDRGSNQWDSRLLLAHLDKIGVQITRQRLARACQVLTKKGVLKKVKYPSDSNDTEWVIND